MLDVCAGAAKDTEEVLLGLGRRGGGVVRREASGM